MKKSRGAQTIKTAIVKVRPLIFAPDGGGYSGVGAYLGPAFEIESRIRDRSR